MLTILDIKRVCELVHGRGYIHTCKSDIMRFTFDNIIDLRNCGLTVKLAGYYSIINMDNMQLTVSPRH